MNPSYSFGRRRTLVAALALLAAVGLSYHQTLSNDFAWDDNYIVLENPAIRDLSSVPDLFTQPWAQGVTYDQGDVQNRAYYRPLALASMAVDWALAGASSATFHATNMVLHLLTSLFLFAWLRLIFERRPSAGPGPDTDRPSAGNGSWLWPLGIALVYAVHPVHTEAVNLVSYRTTLMSGMFVFASLWAFTADMHRVLESTGPVGPGPIRVIAGLVFFACGLLSKETGLVAVGLLLVQDVLLGGLNRKRLLKVYLPLAAISVVYLVVRSQVTGGGVYSFFEGLDPLQGALMVPRIFFLYVRLCVFPDPLCPFYDWNVLGVPGSVLEPDILSGAVLLFAMVAAAVLLRKRQPLTSFGLVFFLVALLPVSHVVPFFDAAGERFLYVPLAGFLIAVAGAARALPVGPGLKKVGLTLALIVFTVFIGLTMKRTAEWKDSETILRASTRDFPASLSANLGLGRLLITQGRPDEAAINLKAAVRIAPDLVVAHGLLAVAQARSGDVRDARLTLMKAPLPGSGLPTAAQIARRELMKKHEFRLMVKLGL
ncbi:MAG: tetratricopeptide repeat protein [Deltaproteobacteria bacterium]|nr:tetratricopeptide repeat protein [Deltaproteobacteria bacterium]